QPSPTPFPYTTLFRSPRPFRTIQFETFDTIAYSSACSAGHGRQPPWVTSLEPFLGRLDRFVSFMGPPGSFSTSPSFNSVLKSSPDRKSTRLNSSHEWI